MTKIIQPMLAKSFTKQNIDGWLMSEKLDGVRAIWNGEKLLSRNGNEFFAPAWFKSRLPNNVCLDGELFIGRGKFQQVVGAVKKKVPLDHEWLPIKYNVFDAPNLSMIFSSRLEYCEELLTDNTIAKIVPHFIRKDNEHAQEFFKEICKNGGEGIMIKNPSSMYEEGRSSNLLKYKPFESDEGKVIGHEEGEGRLAGMLGALIINWKNITFKVGTGLNDELRKTPPNVGTSITFGYCGLTDGGVPRFPTFICERTYE